MPIVIFYFILPILCQLSSFMKMSNPVLSLFCSIYQVESEARFAFIFDMVYFLGKFLLNPYQLI